MIRAPSFILAIVSRLIMPRVSSVRGECRVRKSAAREDVVHLGGVLDTELAEPLVGDEWVICDDMHTEADSPTRDLLADTAETEHAERLPLELHSAPFRALPAALLERCVCLGDVARERHHQPDGLLRGRHHGRLGRVRNNDASPGGRLDVDVVDADPGAPDHLQVRGTLDQIGRELRRRANHDRVVAVDDLLEGRYLVVVDLELRLEQIDPGIRDRFANEDPHRQPAAS